MKIYLITIQPESPFATPLKGDTLFGQFCWQAAYDKGALKTGFDSAIEAYPTQPFAIFSSAFPMLAEDGAFALKRPELPLDALFDFTGQTTESIIEKRKENKKRRWVLLSNSENLACLKQCRYKNDAELAKLALPPEVLSAYAKAGLKVHIPAENISSHNSINRLTGTTTGEGFAPFSQTVSCYPEGMRLGIIVGVDDTMITAEQLCRGLGNIGASGFGRDASTGMGRFSVLNCREIDLNKLGSDKPDSLYTLSSCVPEKESLADASFSPFTRFGRHGDIEARSRNPFKNPVIMADEGAVLTPKNIDTTLLKPYVGTAVTGISKAHDGKSVTQGYALYIPLQTGVQHEQAI